MTTEDEPLIDPQRSPKAAGGQNEAATLSYLGPEARPVTRRFIALVGCRLLALWMLVQGLPVLAGSIVRIVQWVAVVSRVDWSLIGQELLPLGVFVGLFLLLWWLAPWIADRMAGKDSKVDEPITGGASLETPLSAGLAAAGALVLSTALPELLRVLIIFGRSIETIQPFQPELIIALLRCCIGFWLLLGSRGLAGLIRRLRHSDPPDERPASDSSDGPL